MKKIISANLCIGVVIESAFTILLHKSIAFSVVFSEKARCALLLLNCYMILYSYAAVLYGVLETCLRRKSDMV